MKCPRCQHESEAGAKFCEECAAPLARACATCGRPLSQTAKFCPECAHPTGLPAVPPPAQRFDSPESYTPKHLAEKILTSKSALEGERKPVTVLFADLKGSMELLADRDPEEARKLLDPVLEASALRLLGEIHAHRDPPEADLAGDYYRQALALVTERGMRPLAAHCHLGLGKLYRRTGDCAKAEEHLATAIAMYREMDMGFWLTQAEADVTRYRPDGHETQARPLQ